MIKNHVIVGLDDSAASRAAPPVGGSVRARHREGPTRGPCFGLADRA
jgi:hypothetical protein